MKVSLIFLCFFLSVGFTSATTQTSMSQDRPPRLYIKSYSETDAGSGFYHYKSSNNAGTDDHLNFNGNVNYQDGSSASMSWHSHEETSLPDISDYTANFPSSILTEIYSDTGPTWSRSFTNIYVTSIHVGGANGQITVNDDRPRIDNLFQYNPFHTTVTRTVHTLMKLQTGGKPGSKLKNLFKFSGITTAQMSPADAYYGSPVWGTYGTGFGYSYIGRANTITNLRPEQIAIGSYGALSTNGVLYKIIADDDDVDVTPHVQNVDYYSFDFPSPQKYRSYFEVFVNQPSPGKQITHSDTAGHAFWQFKTDAPADALRYISPSLTTFLNHNWGFYPHGALCGTNGILANDDAHGKNVARVFYIGFPDLIGGLQFTRAMSNAPPIYCIAISGYSCVGAATSAGKIAGIKLPSEELDVFPQNFGASILVRFPGDQEDYTPRYSN